ncbi:4,5-dihydroxyphthalate decarboxylase [Sphingobium sp. SCG-1]|uniref:4,5-dihydroxyphthalate decarboxylase n=1 Tax=Sphingobium sp. SCG-1 TaxID=2072936 RepID=UPI000CD6B493|nr:4,5-dihydroxyphthalate decarboxylase [Sphingobium sp. SCG-1]AUW57188.1 4,5-dihydroxyphthalate decarboxylase [Sphingobium sp. SCG-1]
MAKLRLSIASAAYDRVAALRDGRISVECCDHDHLVVGHEQMFQRAFQFAEYDVSELSMSSYLVSLARDDSPYVAVPVFLSRLFRHSAIYLNADAGIVRPEDLRGKRIGVPEYQMTAALWARGLLDDEYGVPPSAMEWFQGGLHETGRAEKLKLNLPDDIRIRSIAADRTLNDLLASGEIDALISARAPRAFLQGDGSVTRLFPEYRGEEQAYFRKTGIFPIMHVLGIRRSLVEEHPWLASSVYDAFVRAKLAADDWLSDVSALRVTLPWLGAELDETRAAMGRDFWPYGVERNRTTLERLFDYAYRHGTVPRRFTLEEVFAPSTLIETRI